MPPMVCHDAMCRVGIDINTHTHTHTHVRPHSRTCTCTAGLRISSFFKTRALKQMYETFKDCVGNDITGALNRNHMKDRLTIWPKASGWPFSACLAILQGYLVGVNVLTHDAL